MYPHTRCCPTTCDPIIFCGMPQNATMLRSPQMRSKKRFFPGGRLKAGLLACPDRNAFPIPSRNQWLETCRGTIEGLTAAGTAADSHGNPFSSRGCSTGPLANLDVTKIENKFVSLPPRTKKMLKIMKHAYVFPGQGAQAVGMGKDLYDNVPAAKELSASRTSCSPEPTSS